MISRRRFRAKARALRPLLLITAINVAIFAFVAGPAIANTFQTAGGLSLGLANSLYCQLTGCTMTGSGGISFDSTSTGGINVRDSASTLIQAGSSGTRYFLVSPTQPRVSTDASSDIQSGRFFVANQVNLTVTSTTQPTASFLRISSAAPVSWTPAAPPTTENAYVSACNVNASDAITMTDGTTYEGSGCVLGTNDCVTFIYDTTTSKWRELSCSNN